MQGLTQERLKEVVSYDPETGKFLPVSRRRRITPGRPLGSIRSHGYRMLAVDGVRYYAHRLAWLYMTGAWPAGSIDHANTDRADNRWANLRQATPSQNGANTVRQARNKSGFKGVFRGELYI
jgi:hypothetical protein